MQIKSDSAELTQQIKQISLELGADLVGVAPVERFETPLPLDETKLCSYLPTGYFPRELLPGAKSVVVTGIRHLSGVLDSNLANLNTTYAFGSFGYVHMNRVLNSITFDLAQWLEEQSWAALPLGPAGAIRFDEEKYRAGETLGPLIGLFSVKRAAVLAGIGRRARNGLVATPQYGTKVRLGAVITTAPLEGSPLLEGEPCPSNCKICLTVCPMQAIKTDGRVDHIKCFSDCGRRGRSLEEVINEIKKFFPLWQPTNDYLNSERSAIDGFGNTLCRVACMAFCPLGRNRAPGW